MRIVQEGPDSLPDYEKVSIAFEVRSRFLPDGSEESVEPRLKDYDADLDERPTAHAERTDIGQWGIFAAIDGESRAGGVIVARDLVDFAITEGRGDVAVIVDLRVDPALRGHGVGRVLFERAVAWAHANGCGELRIETQDTNVAACRFYEQMGCRLLVYQENAYGSELDEARLVWFLNWERRL